MASGTPSRPGSQASFRLNHSPETGIIGPPRLRRSLNLPSSPSRAPFNAKAFVAGSLSAIALPLLFLAAWAGLGLMDVAADIQPAAWESATMTPAVHASVRRSAQGLRNPLPDSEETLIAGGKLYMDDCIGCHGGPGMPTSRFGLTFYPPAPQLWQNGTQYRDAEAFWIGKHGVRWTGMSPQGAEYSDTNLWKLAAFISRTGNLPLAVEKAIQPTPATK